MIDFDLTDEQRLVRDTAREFADAEIAPRAVSRTSRCSSVRSKSITR